MAGRDWVSRREMFPGRTGPNLHSEKACRPLTLAGSRTQEVWWKQRWRNTELKKEVSWKPTLLEVRVMRASLLTGCTVNHLWEQAPIKEQNIPGRSQQVQRPYHRKEPAFQKLASAAGGEGAAEEKVGRDSLGQSQRPCKWNFKILS